MVSTESSQKRKWSNEKVSKRIVVKTESGQIRNAKIGNAQIISGQKSVVKLEIDQTVLERVGLNADCVFTKQKKIKKFNNT